VEEAAEVAQQHLQQLDMVVDMDYKMNIIKEIK
jgi:hypothetical protein